MNLADNLKQPQFSLWANMPVWSLRDAVSLLSRYETDLEGWKDGRQFDEIFKKYKEKISGLFLEGVKSGKIAVDVAECDDPNMIEDLGYKKLFDFKNTLVEKDYFLDWAREQGMKIPSELECVKSPYISTVKVAGRRWSPKKEEEQIAKNLVQSLLGNGCLCDHEQMKKVVAEAADEHGKMIIPMVHLSESGLLKAIKAVYQEQSPSKIRGTAGFKRTNDCPLHKPKK